MDGMTLAILIAVIGIALLLFIFGLQAYLSYQDTNWYGLVLPLTFLFFSVVCSMALIETGMLAAMLYWNIPTAILMVIYFVMKRAKKKQKQAEANGETIPEVHIRRKKRKGSSE